MEIYEFDDSILKYLQKRRLLKPYQKKKQQLIENRLSSAMFKNDSPKKPIVIISVSIPNTAPSVCLTVMILSLPKSPIINK